MRKLFILSFGVMTLCLTATPAMAGYFGFGALGATYTGGPQYELMMSVIDNTTTGSVFNGTTMAWFRQDGWSSLGGDFSLSMTISSVHTGTAHGAGDFTITDTDPGPTPDTITGHLVGDWTRAPDPFHPGTYLGMSFLGELSNVVFNDNNHDGQFNGHIGSLPMTPDSMHGLINAGPLVTDNWFGNAGWTVDTGSVDASVAPVPVPAPGALALTLFGLGLSARLRRFVRRDLCRGNYRVA
jgi:hypothetical protein